MFNLKLRCKSPNFPLNFSILILDSSHTEMKSAPEIETEISMIYELLGSRRPPAVFKTQFVQFHTKKPEQSNHPTCSGFSLVIIIAFAELFSCLIFCCLKAYVYKELHHIIGRIGKKHRDPMKFVHVICRVDTVSRTE